MDKIYRTKKTCPASETDQALASAINKTGSDFGPMSTITALAVPIVARQPMPEHDAPISNTGVVDPLAAVRETVNNEGVGSDVEVSAETSVPPADARIVPEPIANDPKSIIARLKARHASAPSSVVTEDAGQVRPVPGKDATSAPVASKPEMLLLTYQPQVDQTANLDGGAEEVSEETSSLVSLVPEKTTLCAKDGETGSLEEFTVEGADGDVSWLCP